MLHDKRHASREDATEKAQGFGAEGRGGMSVAPYPEYKDSGVEWIGAVPAHWNVLAIKRLSPVQRGASPRPIDDPRYFDDDGEFAWVRIADVTASDGVLRETTQRLSALGASLSVQIAPGELFISIAGSVGKPCIAGIKACIHDGFVYFPHLQDYRDLLFRIFEAGHCYAGLGKMGTQLNLNTDTIGAIKVPVASPEEQCAIAAFLDQETGKIDALVAEQERLIALLKEKRQAVISQAVTKGLNPNAPMKDSGIEWLGQVPAHWDIVPLKQLLRITYGLSQPPEYQPEGIRFLRATNVKRGQLSMDGVVFVHECDLPAGRVTRLSEGDIIVVRSGAYTGDSALVTPDWNGAVAGFDMIARVRDETVPQFVATALLAKYVLEAQINLLRMRAAQPHLNAEELGTIFFLRPPLTEQREILKAISIDIAAIDTLITEATQAITLLRERRAALISAAVTGKIDVRSLTPTKQEAA